MESAETLGSLFGSAIGLAYMGLFGFAVWMWIDALGHPTDRWESIGRSKMDFFIPWYVGGLFTLGLVPMGMSVWYYRAIRPELHKESGASLGHAFSRAPSPALAADLRSLTELHEAGSLSNAEFSSAKRTLLGPLRSQSTAAFKPSSGGTRTKQGRNLADRLFDLMGIPEDEPEPLESEKR